MLNQSIVKISYLMVQNIIKLAKSCFFESSRLEVVIAATVLLLAEWCIDLSEIESKCWYSMEFYIHLPWRVSICNILGCICTTSVVNKCNKLLKGLKGIIVLFKFNSPTFVFFFVDYCLKTFGFDLIQNLNSGIIPKTLKPDTEIIV